MIKINTEELLYLEKLPVTGFNNGGTIYIKDTDTLYKIYDIPIFMREREQNINYMIRTGFIENSGTPIEKIITEDGQLAGFSMKYYHNCKSFRELIYDSEIPFEERKKYIKDIFLQIRELHSRGIILHDVHLDNMIANNNGHLIDLDEIVLPGNELKFKQYYTIAKSKDHPFKNVCTIETDNIKATINGLSILYNFDFETAMIRSGGLKEFLENIGIFFSKDLLEYLKIIFEMESVIYFDEILDSLYESNNENYKKIRK